MKKIAAIFFIIITGFSAGHQLYANDIDCAVTNKLITIKNGRTTMIISNNIGFTISYGEVSGLMSAPSSIYINDGNKKIFFTRTGVQTSEINDKRFGNGKSVVAEAKSGDGRLVAHMYFRTFYRYPDAILVRSTFKNV